jgi:TP901 family phage tail tape measure protein
MTLQEFIIRIRLEGGRAARELQQIMRGSNQAKTGMNAAGASATGFGKKLNGMAKQANAANTSLLRLARSSRMRFGVGGKVGGFGVGATGSLGGVATAGASAQGFQSAIDYGDAINATAQALKLSTDEQEKYSQAVLESSKRIGQSPEYLAGIGLDLARAGVGGDDPAKKIKNVTMATEQWAKASVTAGDGVAKLAGEAGATARVTATLINNFGLEGDALGNAIGSIANVANSTTLDLGNFIQAFSKIGPEVAAAGGKLNDALALTELSARSGKSPALVGGQAASALKDMRDPKKQAKYEALGIDMSGNAAQNLDKVIREFITAKANGDEKRAVAITNAMGRYGQGTILSATGLEMKDFEELNQRMKEGGDLNADYLKRQEAMKQKISSLGAAWNRLWIRISAFTDPIISKAIDVIVWALDNFGVAIAAVAVILKGFSIAGIISRLRGGVGMFGLIGKTVAWFGRMILGAGRLFLSFGGWIARGVAFVLTAIAGFFGLPVLAVAAIAAALAALAAGIWYFWPQIKAALSAGVAAVAAFASRMWDAGVALMAGLWNGIKSKVAGVRDYIAQVGSEISNAFTSFFGINSPSKMFRGYGVNLMEGLNQGLLSMQPNVALAMNGATQGLHNPAGFGRSQSSGGTTVINNYSGGNSVSVRGNGDQYLDRVAKKIVRGDTGMASNRRNLAR